MITPTRESLRIVNGISENMDGNTFHHHFHILYDIRSQIEKETVKYLEIGTHSGASACLMLLHPKKTQVFGMDLPESPRHDSVSYNTEKFKNPHNTFNYFQGNSRDPKFIESIKNEVGNVDMLFIDGDHTMDAVIDDFLNYKDLVNPGGYIIFDDYNDVEHNPVVKHGVDYIVKELLFDEYDVLGFCYNKLGAYPLDMLYNNEFVIRKKN
jgi:hypothetical protein